MNKEDIMPGILYHLSFAEEVYRHLPSSLDLDKISFMAGNLIPDLAVDKKKSHYRKDASVKGFFVPDMEAVKEELYVPTNPIKFGMYCHLYLDNFFIEEFLIPEFIWDNKNMKVINPRNHLEWDVPTFFSQDGMYGSYTEINQLLIRDGLVSMQTVAEIPEVLPNTGMEVFDNRRKKTWKKELEEYIAEKKPYTGNIFNYERLWASIERIVFQFINESFSK